MSSSFISSKKLPIANGVGTVGYRVFDADGTELAARSIAGVVRIFAGHGYGIYQVLITVADGVTAGTVVWDDANGNASEEGFFIGSTNIGSVSVGEYDSELDATWGGAAADSYLSLVDAETLIQKYVWNTTVWSASSGQKRDQALRMATVRIDMVPWVGSKQSYGQKLQWPRAVNFLVSAYRPSVLSVGSGITEAEVLADVQFATMFEAIDLVSQRGMERHRQNIAAGLKQVSESVGPIRDQYTYQSGGPATLLSVEANRIMAKYQQGKMVYRA